MQIRRIVCLHQFIKTEPSNIIPPGWGWCVRKLDDGTIVYCKKNRWNKNCAGYCPITLTMINVKEKNETNKKIHKK